MVVVKRYVQTRFVLVKQNMLGPEFILYHLTSLLSFFVSFIHNKQYDAHHDYFDKTLYQNDPGTLKNFIQYGRRNRMITVFWYLSDVEEGGETVFPRFGGGPPPFSMSDCNTGLKVKPVRGKVIIFYSLKPDGSLDPLSLHGACPVKKGVKWAANKWVWNAPIEFGSGR